MNNGWKDLQESLDQLQASDTLKEHTRAYLAWKTKGYRRGAALLYRKIAVAVACFALLLLAGGGYSAYFIPVTTISVDVNPSIELGINRYDRVISVQSFNEDGAALIAAKDVRFLDYKKAIDELLAADSMAPYLTQDYLIDITVFGADEDRSGEILENLAGSTVHYDNVHCSSGNSEDVQQAHSHGMSCGKYQAFLQLYALDPTVTIEEVQALTTRQIRDRISELSKEPDSAEESGSTETDSSDDADEHGGHHGSHGHGH